MAWGERLQLDDLLEADLTLNKDFLEVGVGAFGRRRIVRLEKGTCTFLAKDLLHYQGKVMTAADFALYSELGDIVQIDVRSVVEIDLGNDHKAYIYVQYQNDVLLSAETREEITRGNTIGFSRSNFIVQPRFEVGVPQGVESPAIAALQRLVHTRVVAHAELSPLRIRYRMYEVVNPSATT